MEDETRAHFLLLKAHMQQKSMNFHQLSMIRINLNYFKFNYGYKKIKETETMKKVTNKKIGAAKQVIGNLRKSLENCRFSQKYLKPELPPIPEGPLEDISLAEAEAIEKTKLLTERLNALQTTLKGKKQIYTANKQTMAEYCNRFLSTKESIEKSNQGNTKVFLEYHSGISTNLSCTELSNHQYIRSKVSDISLYLHKARSKIESQCQKRENISNTLSKCLGLSENALKLHSKLILKEHLQQVLSSAVRKLEKELVNSTELKSRLEQMEQTYEGCENTDIELLHSLKFEISVLENEVTDSTVETDTELLKNVGFSGETTARSVNDIDEDTPEIGILFSESLDSRSPDEEKCHRRIISIQDAEF